jgi:CRP-like cAMP-binding protein
MDTIERLRTIPLFAELDEAGLEQVARVATEFEAEAGHVLIHPGMEGSGLFVVEEGTLGVDLPHGVTEIGAGQFVGELSLLAPGILRTARVHALTAVRCVAISRADFEALLRAEPRIAAAMLPVLARRLADLMEHLI